MTNQHSDGLAYNETVTLVAVTYGMPNNFVYNCYIIAAPAGPAALRLPDRGVSFHTPRA
jgi:hypothetical protein